MEGALWSWDEVFRCSELCKPLFIPLEEFAHADSSGGGAAVYDGNKGGTKQVQGGQGKGVQQEHIWTDICPEFDILRHPPRSSEWHEFFSDR